MNNFLKQLINQKESIKTALEKLNNVPENLTLFVTDDGGKLVGTLTDGDVRRGLLAGKSYEEVLASGGRNKND